MAQRTDAQPQAASVNGAMLRSALTWAVEEEIFADLKRHGNTSWSFPDLILLTLVWVWSGNPTLTGAFSEAQRWSLRVLGHVAVTTFQGLLKALQTWTTRLLPLLGQRLHQLMEAHGSEHWRVGRWLALAVDGSRVSVPRTQANEQAFCAPNYGSSSTARSRRKKNKGKRTGRKANKKPQPVKPQPVKPQLWLTLLWHVGLRMPWSWKSGPSHSSERDHFQKMLQEQQFPHSTLFCADAGFTGYELWKAIIDAGHSFLIRVGGNVTLLRRLGYYARERDGIVYCWPDHAARRQQPPLVLRLLRLQVGRCQMSLLTNVLSEKKLSHQQAIRLYQLRWGVELQFRTIKQTFGRRKLRSRTPQRAYVEMDWSLMGLWMIQLFAVKEQIAVGEAPQHCSVSLAIQIIRALVHQCSERCDEPFAKLLQAARKDSYQRKGSKEARYKPRYKDKPAAGEPEIVTATQEHKEALRRCLSIAT